MRRRPPISLSDLQLQTLMLAAKSIQIERRHSFLLAVSTKLKLSRTQNVYPSDVLVGKIIDAVLAEMQQVPA
jgi:hypothetical protein